VTTPRLRVRPTTADDIPGIIELSQRIYGPDSAWAERQLRSHLEVFPEGQFVAVLPDPDGSQRVVGMSASLIVDWDDYELADNWRDFTDAGMFTNFDPGGSTLYGAEVMADPEQRRRGIGSGLYRARSKLLERLGLLRIRAGARLRGYHRFADRVSAEEYTASIVRKEHRDPTLSFQLGRGFEVIGVVPGYLRLDPESQGWAAVIEYLNPALATEIHRRPQREWRRRMGLPRPRAREASR
jgi:ribosomal protein S18 acetylase RimI-like enzyme